MPLQFLNTNAQQIPHIQTFRQPLVTELHLTWTQIHIPNVQMVMLFLLLQCKELLLYLSYKSYHRQTAKSTKISSTAAEL